MADRPILFSAPMVRALLDGRKTQTRRVLKAKRGCTLADFTIDAGPALGGMARRLELARDKLAVPYAAGDRLWVREAAIPDPPMGDEAWEDWTCTSVEFDGCGRKWGMIPDALRSPDHCIFKADPKWAGHQGWRWRPGIHMPRWASRLTLHVEDAKVERLQDISEGDAIAEGIACDNGLPEDVHRCHIDLDPSTGGADWLQSWDARDVFRQLWHEINGPGAWEANPWVVAIAFRVERANIGAKA